MIELFKNKKFLMVISIVASFLLWLTVSLVIRPTGDVVIQDVGVNVNVQSGILGELGLSVIDGAEGTVDITISGSRSVIGGVLAEDISVTPSLSGVSGAGVYQLELRAINTSQKEFEISSISPSSITVKFDKFVDKTLKLTHVIGGEYNIPDEYIQEETYTDIKEVIVTGPEIDLAEIQYAVVEVELSGDYSGTVAIEGEIVLLDENGEAVEYSRDSISLSSDTATVFIPVHKTSNLPVSFDYTNLPKFFDPANLGYTLSVSEILLEGEDHIIDKYSDIFLGYIDIRDISLDNPFASFAVEIPEGLSMQTRVDVVDIEFDLEGYVESTFRTGQINIVNVPKGYTVTANTGKVSVTLIGPEEVINALSANDIVVEIDLSTREITQTGQYRIQADVFLPGGQNAWATGTYSVTVTVKES